MSTQTDELNKPEIIVTEKSTWNMRHLKPIIEGLALAQRFLHLHASDLTTDPLKPIEEKITNS